MSLDVIKRNKRGLFIGASIILGAFFISTAGLPWLKPEIVVSATVVSIDDNNSCFVETTSRDVINIANCGEHSSGDQVTVKYRRTTYAGEIVR